MTSSTIYIIINGFSALELLPSKGAEQQNEAAQQQARQTELNTSNSSKVFEHA